MMPKIYALLVLCALALGCSPETRTKTVDRPDGTPMDLPEWGWNIRYSGSMEDSNGDSLEIPEEESFCWIRRHKSGAALDYCGFTAWVTGDAFSFDGLPYLQASWYGTYEITVSGAGDADGASLHIEGRDANDSNSYSYTIDYEVEHVSEFEH